jgi:4'-phosphopantetheinyl transferase
MLRVYYAEIAALPDQPGALPLSSYRLAKLSSCRSPEKRRQGIGAELLLIHALRSWKEDFPLPLSLEKEPGGKPFLSGSPIQFSLSHSGEYAACALCDDPVGIDLETERPLREPLLRRCFREGERRRILESEHPAASFTALWTRKESYLKATGEGLRALGEIDLCAPPEDAFFHAMQQGALHLSVCVLGRPADPERIEKVELANTFLDRLSK